MTAQAAGVRRIVVLGCAGAGKTTFARRLGERIGALRLRTDHEADALIAKLEPLVSD